MAGAAFPPPSPRPPPIFRRLAGRRRGGGRAGAASPPASAGSATFAGPGAAVLTGACPDSFSPAPMTNPSLATLNAEQRRAVEHGDGEARPLLIIPGAPSGQTHPPAPPGAHPGV